MRNQVNHPLSDRRSLERAVAEALQGEPETAIDELLPWIDSLVGNSDLAFADKAHCLVVLGTALVRPVRHCTDQYLAALSGESVESASRLRGKVQAAWAVVLEASGEILITLAAGAETVPVADLEKIAVCVIQAASQLMRWNAFAGQADPQLWARLNLAFRLAAQAGCGGESGSKPRGDGDPVFPVGRAYTAAVAFHSLEPAQLDAESLELAWRLVAYVLERLELASAPATTSIYWVDLTGSAAPARIVQLPRQPVMPRYFAGAWAVGLLQEILELSSVGNVPPALVLRHTREAGALPGVLGYMIRRWSSDVPLRSQKRHDMPASMRVVLGLDDVLGCLQGSAPDEHGVADPLSWQVHDVSRRGVGFDVQAQDVAGIRIGSLIAMRAEDVGCWRVGTVRRFRHLAGSRCQIGVELVGDEVAAALVRDGVWQMQALRVDPLNPGATVRLIFPRGALHWNLSLFLTESGRTFRLGLLPGREYGADHEICTFVVTSA